MLAKSCNSPGSFEIANIGFYTYKALFIMGIK